MNTLASPVRSRPLVTFLAALAVGAMLAGAIAAFAGSGDDPIKRKPVRDQPGEVQPSDLPRGEALWELGEPKEHGNFTVFPPGQFPSPRWLEPSGERTFEHLGGEGTTGVNTARDAGLAVSPEALPPGYSVTGGGALLIRFADSSTVINEAGLSIQGSGYPIDVKAWRPFQYEVGDPYPLPSWTASGSRVVTILGTIGGRPAVFVHRRPGIMTQELQQVWVDDGEWIIMVEGYVDEFQKLIKIAESILTNRAASQ
jgi:hypothetical protein